MNLEAFEQCVINHFEAKGLYEKSTAKDQCLKLVEEVGELCKAVLEDRLHSDKCDGIGDCMVVLVNIAHAINEDLAACAGVAWSEIKDRTGKMVNGTFLRDS